VAVLSLLFLVGLTAPPRAAAVTEFFHHPEFAAAVEPLTVVGFDTLPPGNGRLAGHEFAALGLTIVNLNGWPINVIQNTEPGSHGGNWVTPANVSSPPNVISASLRVSDGYGNVADNFDFIFATPVSAAGLVVGNLGSCLDIATRVQFLDESGELIAEELVSRAHAGAIAGSAYSWGCANPIAPFDNRIFYGITADGPVIKRIRVLNGAADDDAITIDDVQWGTAATPVVARAGEDQTRQEGDRVQLDGTTGSGAGLTFEWTQLAGPPAVLDDPSSATPTFTAPLLPGGFGSQTLTFQLTVRDAHRASADTVDVTVVNVNHRPIADAGDRQTVREAVPVALSAARSFDDDGDLLIFAWVQTGGSSVALDGADTAAPTFSAPWLPGGVGSAEVLTFEVTVSDGVLAATDEVTVIVEQDNHAPVADAGPPQTVRPGVAVTLDGSGSSDPDGDAIAWSWTQVAGPPVPLAAAGTAAPRFTATPANDAIALTFRLAVTDGELTGAAADVVVTVNNGPPRCDLARAVPDALWPPDHRMAGIGIAGVTDPEDRTVMITVTAVTQDEPVNGLGDGDTAPDAVIAAGPTLLRAERGGLLNGRVYVVHFAAADGEGGACTGAVRVGVPRSKKAGEPVVDDGQLYDATRP
jgi:hypothetical protein